MDFLQEVFVFLVAALIAVPLLNRLGLSSVIGYLVAGIVIGPSALGLIKDPASVLHFAELGVVLLLFLIGLELQPRRLWVMRNTVFGLGTLQVTTVTLTLAALLHLALGLELIVAIVLGFSLALSSTAFVLQLLAENKELNSAHGRAGFGVLLFQDMAVIPAIVVLSALANTSQSSLDLLAVAAVVVLGVVARFVLKPVLRAIASTGISELFIAAGLTIVCGAALAMYSAGLSMGLGAFVAGMLVADSEYRHQLETDVLPFKGLLLGLFFIAVGMSADLSLLVTQPLQILGLTVGLVVVKTLVLWPLTRWFGMTNQAGFKTAVVLSQGGEFAFVLLTAAVAAQVVPQAYTSIAIMVVTLSMATTPFLMMALDWFSNRGTPRDFDEPKPVYSEKGPVIIAGFGRFSQIVARVLAAQRQPFTALDASPGHVDFVREFGNEVYYGDATRLDLLQTAGVAEASAVVIAISDVEASTRLVEVLRERYPDLPLFVRARNRWQEIKLRELGVRYVIRETLLSSLELSRSLLAHLELDPDAVDVFKAHDEDLLARQAVVAHDPQAYRATSIAAADELADLFSEAHQSGAKQ